MEVPLPAYRSKIVTLVHFYVTVGFLGYLPYAPGTWTSLFAMGLWWLVAWDSVLGAALVAFLFLSGGLAASFAEKAVFFVKDSRAIVLDEVAGAWVACLIMRPEDDFFVLLVLFCVFRVFDILKPFPIRLVEKLPGGWGVMADDIVAGFYTLLSMQILKFLLE